MEEIDIIRKSQLGDMEAFNELYKLYVGRAMKTAYFISGNKTTAEDIVQEAFTEAYLRIKTMKTPETFYRWFYSILVRTGWKVTAKSKKSVPVENIFDDTEGVWHRKTLEETIETREINEKIRNTLNGLSVPLKTVIVLYYYNDMPVKDIAKVTGCFQGTVKSRLHKARLLIKKSLTGHYDEGYWNLSKMEGSV